jgi:hypothetical protein
MQRRSYVYYSDRKILELQAQVPSSRLKRAFNRVEQVGATVFGTGGTIAIRPPEEEPLLRAMQTVWMDLGDEGRIGTFDEPKDFFYGTLVFFYDVYDTVDPPVFFLLGATDRTIVGLGGSTDHVRGFRGRQIRAKEGSPYVVMEPDVAEVIYRAEARRRRKEEISPTAPAQDLRAIHVAGMLKNWEGCKGNKMEFEVLARKEGPLLQVSSHVEPPRQVLFGSPVFVAQASEADR